MLEVVEVMMRVNQVLEVDEAFVTQSAQPSEVVVLRWTLELSVAELAGGGWTWKLLLVAMMLKSIQAPEIMVL